MSKILVSLSIMLFLTFSLAACSSSSGMKELTKEANKTTVEVAKGEKVIIKLESNPTTGYMWEVEEVDSSVLKPAGESTFESDSNLVGASGYEIFTFEAVGSGETTLKMKYWRSFEPDNPPIEVFEVTVQVK